METEFKATKKNLLALVEAANNTKQTGDFIEVDEIMNLSNSLKTVVSWWRDLNIGEEIKVGDRFLNENGEWETFDEDDLEYNNNIVGKYDRPVQRKQNN